MDSERAAPLQLRLRRRASALGATRMRRELTQWMNHAGVPPAIVGDIALSAYEAMANTVQHAYPPDTVGPIEVNAELDHGAIVVTVVDHGCWREPSRSRTCHGLRIIRALSPRASVVPGPHGTTVRMSWPRFGPVPAR